MRREGAAPANSTEPRFEFVDPESKNIFQLEAVTEFYANFDDPWAVGAQPRQPGSTGYIEIDFLNPSGEAAVANGEVVTLDGSSDLSRGRNDQKPSGQAATLVGNVAHLDGTVPLQRVLVNHDYLYLENATGPNRSFLITAVHLTQRTVTLQEEPTLTQASSAWQINLGNIFSLLYLHSDPTRVYRITSIHPTNRTVTVNGTPNLAGGSSAWEIIMSPVILLIDSFGHRLSGKQATVDGDVVTLEKRPSKVNRQFDTIFLESDTAKASRTYRIQAINDAAKTVTVSGRPVLSEDSSPWRIPGGLGGTLPAYGENELTGSNDGFDHYLGVAFLLYSELMRQAGAVSVPNASVAGPFRFTSYTSRYNGDHIYSSVRGNRHYQIYSVRSSNSFRNFSLAVTTSGSTDHVAGARNYFGGLVGAIDQDANVTPDVDGKSQIRFHHGNRADREGTGSAGCLVHYAGFYGLRTKMALIYLAEHNALDPNASDDAVRRVSRAGDLRHSKTLYGTLQDGWAYKLRATLWLIRPDERAVGP